MEYFAFAFLVLIALCAACFVAYLQERKDWNGGVCRANGKPWQYFDTDSQGGRGYKAGDSILWVSYPGVDG